MKNNAPPPLASSSSQPSDKPPPQTDGERRSELARLLPLWPIELADLSLEGRRRIIKTLERALRTERKRGQGGHWAYDLARHAALVRNWKCECAALRTLELQNAVAKEKRPPKSERF